jgi:hypothetical protein
MFDPHSSPCRRVRFGGHASLHGRPYKKWALPYRLMHPFMDPSLHPLDYAVLLVNNQTLSARYAALRDINSRLIASWEGMACLQEQLNTVRTALEGKRNELTVGNSQLQNMLDYAEKIHQ